MSVGQLAPLSSAREKILARLQSKKFRREQGLFLAEGVRLVEEALACGVRIDWAVAAPSSGERALKLIQGLQEGGVQVFAAAEKILRRSLDVATPQAVAAVCGLPENNLEDLSFGVRALVAVCDGLKEPGNLGAVIRVAAAAGAQAVLLGPGTVDPYNPRVLRGSMGASFRLPVVEVDQPALLQEFLEKNGFSVFRAAAGGQDIFSGPDVFPQRTALVLGSEAEGPVNFPQTGGTVGIPMAAGVESLNVAVAAGILLYEISARMAAPPASL